MTPTYQNKLEIFVEKWHQTNKYYSEDNPAEWNLFLRQVNAYC